MRVSKDVLMSPMLRSRLPVMDWPAFIRIREGRHLGYNRGMATSSWFARLRLRQKKYRQCRIGAADDCFEANGADVLSYEQAVAAADAWCDSYADVEMQPTRAYERPNRFPELPPPPPYTVAHATVDYLKWYRHNRRSFPVIYYCARTHILPALGAIPVADLKAATIRGWLDAMAETPARVTNARDAGPRFRPYSNDPEVMRRRRNTCNRTLRVLKTILTQAYEYGHVEDCTQWARVRSFRRVDFPKVRFLTPEQYRSLVAAAPADLARLISGGLLSGCRIAELRSMRVDAFLRDTGRLFIADGKGGKPRHVGLSQEGAEFFLRMTDGRRSSELMFLRTNGLPWRLTTHTRALHQASVDAGIDPPINFHALRHTYATELASAGVPFEVLARQLGHADTRLVLRRYAHLGNAHIDEIVRQKMPRMLN